LFAAAAPAASGAAWFVFVGAVTVSVLMTVLVWVGVVTVVVRGAGVTVCVWVTVFGGSVTVLVTV